MPGELPPLPSHLVEAYQGYLGFGPQSREQLIELIEDYLDRVAHASGENEFLDTRLARSLCEGLTQLSQAAPDDQLAHVQAAVLYFTTSDDVEHDFHSLLGFDDDAAVYNGVCDHLGLPELKVTL